MDDIISGSLFRVSAVYFLLDRQNRELLRTKNRIVGIFATFASIHCKTCRDGSLAFLEFFFFVTE